jgi:hypothetical protein
MEFSNKSDVRIEASNVNKMHAQKRLVFLRVDAWPKG